MKLNSVNPVTGQKMSLTPSSIFGMILGGVALLGVFGLITKAFGLLTSAVPGASNWLGTGYPIVRPASPAQTGEQPNILI